MFVALSAIISPLSANDMDDPLGNDIITFINIMLMALSAMTLPSLII